MSGRQTREIVELTLERDRYKAALDRIQETTDRIIRVYTTPPGADMYVAACDANVRSAMRQVQAIVDQAALPEKKVTAWDLVNAARGVKP